MNRFLKISGTAAVLSALALALPLSAAAAKPAKAAPLPDLSQEQIDSAGLVLLGKSECEFNQSVDVSELPAKKGYFVVEHKGKKYTLATEATTSGAVRLEDKKSGVIWLQIANKSMLMKAGHRLVDNCVHPSQKS